MNIHDGKYVEMKDVSTLYDDIISTVREAYRNDGIATDKSLMSIVVKRGEIVSGRLQVKLLLITGRTAKKHLDIKLEPFSPLKMMLVGITENMVVLVMILRLFMMPPQLWKM